jgi:hypothetical protein
MNEKILQGLVDRFVELWRTAGEGISEYRVTLFEDIAEWYGRISGDDKQAVISRLNAEICKEYSRMKVTLREGYIG